MEIDVDRDSRNEAALGLAALSCSIPKGSGPPPVTSSSLKSSNGTTTTELSIMDNIQRHPLTEVVSSDSIHLLHEALQTPYAKAKLNGKSAGALYAAFEERNEPYSMQRDLTHVERGLRETAAQALMVNRKLQHFLQTQIKSVDAALSKNKRLFHEAESVLNNEEKFNTPHFVHWGQILFGPKFFANEHGIQPIYDEEEDKRHSKDLFVYRWQGWWKREREKLVDNIRHMNRRVLARKLMTEGKDVIKLMKQLRPKEIDALVPPTEVDYTFLADEYMKDRSPLECAIQWSRNDHPSINNGPWDVNEIDRLDQIATAHGNRDWEAIAKEHGNHRTSAACFRQWKKSHYVRVNWSVHEDKQLRMAVNAMGTNNWNAVSRIVGSRNSGQCNARWKVIGGGRKKGRWTQNERDALKLAIEKFGTNDFVKIAEIVGTRTAAQCRERWHNVDKPGIKSGKEISWTLEQDMQLLHLVKKIGQGKWARIASEIGQGFTDAHCRQRYAKLKSFTKDRRRHVNEDETMYLKYSFNKMGQPETIEMQSLLKEKEPQEEKSETEKTSEMITMDKVEEQCNSNIPIDNLLIRNNQRILRECEPG